MEHGIEVSVVWFDNDVVELCVRGGNGTFSGEAEGYAPPEAMSLFADAIRGFPAQPDDRRTFEIGTFDDQYAGGGARFEFSCLDSAGHASVFVRLRADPRADPHDPISTSAEFHIPVVASSIDLFVSELERMTLTVGSVARLSVS